jgi:hypothetical protein
MFAIDHKGAFPVQPRMPGPAVQKAERTRSKVILIIATVIYALSLLPWMLMLLFAPMLYDSGVSATANLMMVGVLGWPIVVVVSLILGWRMRSYKGAGVGFFGPIGFALVIVLLVQIVNPSFFNLRGLLPDAKALKPADQQLAGLSLGTDEDVVISSLGKPPAAHTPDRSTLSPQEAIDAARLQTSVSWEYKAVGITLVLANGKVEEIEASAPWTGTTPRGLGVGADLARAIELYGDRHGTDTSFDAPGKRDTYWYTGKGFGLRVSGGPDGKVMKVTVRTQNY